MAKRLMILIIEVTMIKRLIRAWNLVAIKRDNQFTCEQMVVVAKKYDEGDL